MSYIFAGNIQTGQRVRATAYRPEGIRAWGDYKFLIDRIQVGGKLRLLFDDGSVKRVEPGDVFEVAPKPVQP